MALRMLADKVTGIVARQYKSALASKLQQTGLRYEDIVNENEKAVSEALSLADPDVVEGRTRRLKRAIDLSFKRKNFMDYAPDVDQETFKLEFYEDVEKIKAREEEYAMLNAHNK
mmetsp:Transcript_3735/g.4580  ORF Transcript_3735/g.4580 Transcript_3735/m.4580 type:complete len:115 (-) Transcript_3735:247-591(-)|eukprot:CAMPEP_0203639524 /NCGR_PEP_ID=MMETSP0088-20131115/5258_1 /ASSEMBLY_ACC=CAM_ASM_001087 /TAXON_ID=426623 /ORGANISM="Chaetoceros affinis, Strain CCMP159" /LENGTH=114 /DNA_ID=CAMNT_0050494437 /DNA_START=31 /DNA_END=375 /DNA_ORIENTATION=-